MDDTKRDGTDSVAPKPTDESPFALASRLLSTNLKAAVSKAGNALFKVKLPPSLGKLSAVYRAHLPTGTAEVACSRSTLAYIDSFGLVATLQFPSKGDLSIRSVVWDERSVPEDNPFRAVVRALRKAIQHPESTIETIFVWPTPSKEVREKEASCAHWVFHPEAGDCYARLDLPLQSYMHEQEDRRRSFEHAVGALRAADVSRVESMLELECINGWQKMLPACKFLARTQAALFGTREDAELTDAAKATAAQDKEALIANARAALRARRRQPQPKRAVLRVQNDELKKAARDRAAAYKARADDIERKNEDARAAAAVRAETKAAKVTQSPEAEAETRAARAAQRAEKKVTTRATKAAKKAARAGADSKPAGAAVGTQPTVVATETAVAVVAPQAISERASRLLWRAVATNPPGWLTPRASLLGVVLTMVGDGWAEKRVRKAMNKMFHPLKYRRMDREANDSELKQARNLFEKLNLNEALRRRFATLDDVAAGTLWRCPEERVRAWDPEIERRWAAGDAQGALAAAGCDAPTAVTTSAAPEPEETAATPKEQPNPFDTTISKLREGGEKQKGGACAGDSSTTKLTVPTDAINHVRFLAEVLPETQCVWLKAKASDNFAAMITAVSLDAPIIFKWDDESFRNPCSWYLYSGRSNLSQWFDGSVRAHSWLPVTALCKRPSHWNDETSVKTQDACVFIALAGCQDANLNGICLFPDDLRHELQPVRRAIETAGENLSLEPYDESHKGRLASGLYVGDETVTLRVLTRAGEIVDYTYAFTGYTAVAPVDTL